MIRMRMSEAAAAIGARHTGPDVEFAGCVTTRGGASRLARR